MKLSQLCVGALLFLTANLSAGTIHLLNDTPFMLRAVVRGNDGTYLGEVVIQPEQSSTWTDTYGQTGHFGKGEVNKEYATRSQTPYTVRWSCMDGNDFSVCDNVATGGTVSANACDGRRICKPPEKKSGAYPAQPAETLPGKTEEPPSE